MRYLHFWHHWIFDDLDITNIDYELSVLAVAAGIIDGSTYNQFSMFISNQTGNLIYLAMLTAGLQPASSEKSLTAHDQMVRSIISFFCFFFAVFLTGRAQLVHGGIQKRRWWLMLVQFFQGAIFFVVAAVFEWIPSTRTGTKALSLIATLSFMSGVQIGVAKSMISHFPTMIVTAPISDLLLSHNVLEFYKDRALCQRLANAVFIYIGGIIGAFCFKYRSASLGFLLSAILKTIIAFAFVFHEEDPREGRRQNCRKDDDSREEIAA